MLRDIACGKEKVVDYQNTVGAAPIFTERLKAGTWFGLAEVDIEIPKRLWLKFEEMPPFFTKHQTKGTLTHEGLLPAHRQNNS